MINNNDPSILPMVTALMCLFLIIMNFAETRHVKESLASGQLITCLKLYAPTPQNGQTHSNNSSATAVGA